MLRKNGFHHKIEVWSGCPKQTCFFSLSYTNGPSFVSNRPHFQTLISLKPGGQTWSNFMCSITGMGERLHKVLGQIGSKLWFPWQQKPPLTYNGENNVSTFSRLFFIWSFLYLQVTRTCIKSRTSSNFCQTGPLTTELYALERSHWFWMGENGVSIFSQWLWIQTSSNLQEMRTGIKSWTGSNFGRIWPVILELPALQRWKKNDVSSFSQSPLIGSLSNLQVMRTDIKARINSNLGQIGLFTLELFALEHRFLIPGAIYMF